MGVDLRKSAHFEYSQEQANPFAQILEGLLTIVVAFIAFWALSDNPKSATFLDERETREVQVRLANDNDDLADYYDKKFVFDAFKDYKIWIQSLYVLDPKQKMQNYN